MLHNPKWDTTTDLFNVNTFIGWLEQQPSDQTFSYFYSDNCAIGQYLTAHGQRYINFMQTDTSEFKTICQWNMAISANFRKLPVEERTSRTYPLMTFGATLDRMREFAKTGNT